MRTIFRKKIRFPSARKKDAEKKEQEEFEQIFRNPVSRNVWLCMMRMKHPHLHRHPQGPGIHFHQDCLNIAERAGKHLPETIRELKDLLRMCCADRVFSGTDYHVKNLALMLFPYVIGKSDLPHRYTDPR